MTNQKTDSVVLGDRTEWTLSLSKAEVTEVKEQLKFQVGAVPRKSEEEHNVSMCGG